MARRTGFSRSYLGNVERGVRPATPAVIRAYEKALGGDVNRRSLLLGMVSTVVVGAVPDVAVDVVRDISAERSKLLSTVQTSHETDRIIGSLVAKDTPCIGSLVKWMRRGSPVLRVNSAGILAKVGAPAIDNDVIDTLKRDEESRLLYLQAVVSRVLAVPWDDAGRLAASAQPLSEQDQLDAFATEVRNSYDSAARWCSVLMLARSRKKHPEPVSAVLGHALRKETSRENLRAIAGTLAGLDPLTV
jgi:hypothetical protein